MGGSEKVQNYADLIIWMVPEGFKYFVVAHIVRHVHPNLRCRNLGASYSCASQFKKVPFGAVLKVKSHVELIDNPNVTGVVHNLISSQNSFSKNNFIKEFPINFFVKTVVEMSKIITFCSFFLVSASHFY